MNIWYSRLILFFTGILYLVVIALWVSIPDELILNLTVSVVTIVLTLGYLFYNRKNFQRFYQAPLFKKMQESIVFFILFFCLLSIVNYWFYKHPSEWDLTSTKINSLSEQTKNILKTIKGELSFKIFSRKAESYAWMALLEIYRSEKNSIKIEKIDIDVRPDLVAKYGIQNSPTVVVMYEGKIEKITVRDELNVTNALARVSRLHDPIAYFVQGHGEGDIASNENEGLKFIYEAAKNQAMDIRPLNLLTTQAIPFDAKAVILWGPKSSLQDSEIEILRQFLKNNGHMLVALDPSFNGDPHVKLKNFLREYQIEVRNDLVLDRKKFVNASEGTIPTIDEYAGDHTITRTFKGQTFFPLTSSIAPLSAAVGAITPLMSTSAYPDSWGEADVKQIVSQNMVFDRNIDYPGPLNLAIAFESKNNRMVVFGNSSFVINAYMKFGSNYTLFLNSLSWILGEDRLVSLNLPVIQSTPIFISGPQIGIIFYFLVLFLPLILFIVAIASYRRRRTK